MFDCPIRGFVSGALLPVLLLNSPDQENLPGASTIWKRASHQCSLQFVIAHSPGCTQLFSQIG